MRHSWRGCRSCCAMQVVRRYALSALRWAVALLALVAAGCWEQVDREWFAQMKEQPSIQHLENRAPWDPPAHTVPVGSRLYQLPAHDEMLLAGNPMNSPVARAFVNPVDATLESIARG